MSFSCPAEPPERQIAKLMRFHFYRVLTMMDGDGLVVAAAFVLELRNTGVYHVDYLCVRPGLRGNGIGSQFLRAVIDFLQRDGKYDLVTLESETRMIPWYIKHGLLDLSVKSDMYEDLTWFLLTIPLSKQLAGAVPFALHPTVSLVLPITLSQVVFELKSMLAVAVSACKLEDIESSLITSVLKVDVCTAV